VDGKITISDVEKINGGCDRCGAFGKTLYPIEIMEDGFSKKVYYCTDCIELNDKEYAQYEIEERRRSLIAKYLIDSGIPKMFEFIQFKDFTIPPEPYSDINRSHINNMGITKEKVLKIYSHIAGGEQRMSVFSGPYGTGKSLLAVAMMRHLIVELCKPAKFYHCGRLVRSMMDNALYNEYLLHMEMYDLIVLDEVEQATASEFTIKTLSDIINMVYINKKSIILTTNCTEKELVKKYLGERGYDRICESPDSYIKFEWPSFRGRKI